MGGKLISPQIEFALGVLDIRESDGVGESVMMQLESVYIRVWGRKIVQGKEGSKKWIVSMCVCVCKNFVKRLFFSINSSGR